MIISLAWLRRYIETSLSPQEIADILTSIGLEVASVEERESIRGGLSGLIVAEVLSCQKHPNADRLKVCAVNIGEEQPLQIVCGAPNVAEGQKVALATVGTSMYHGDETFQIKKSKIRGELSEGMLCSEKEMGLGEGQDGIMILEPSLQPGTPLAEVFHPKKDVIFEIDITPNRIDACSHYGVARDLYAYLSLHQPAAIVAYRKPSFEPIASPEEPIAFSVEVERDTQTRRYCGVALELDPVGESCPEIKEYLSSIGQKCINSVVDVTNFVLHSIGQPLHAFELGSIARQRLLVRSAKAQEKLLLLDGTELKLCPEDNVIASPEQALCLAGVMGGLESGVNSGCQQIFLEAACFSPSKVRRTAKRYGISTDSSFRFERELAPEGAMQGLQMAVSLLRELYGARVISATVDVQPVETEEMEIDFSQERLRRLTGCQIPREQLLSILETLDIEVLGAPAPDADLLRLRLPSYRADVKRFEDVAEDVLRIYGFEQIPLSDRLHACISARGATDKNRQRQRKLSDILCGAGFSEILNNSLTAASFFTAHGLAREEELVKLLNPLSSDLNVLRPSMIKGGLESIEYNLKRKSGPLQFFEWGHVYQLRDKAAQDVTKAYQESACLALWIAADKKQDHWLGEKEAASVFLLKAYVYEIFQRLAVPLYQLQIEEAYGEGAFDEYQRICTKEGEPVCNWGILSSAVLKDADIDVPVFYAEFYTASLFRLSTSDSLCMHSIPKYPAVRRDFALLLDQDVRFVQIEAVAYGAEPKLLKKMTLFDVYEDAKHLPPGKKSYAVAFELQDPERTLSEKQIEKSMKKIRERLEQELGAQLR